MADINFGNESKEGEYSASGNYIRGMKATSGESPGTGKSITVYIKQSGASFPKIKCALYDDSSPMSKLGETEEWTVTEGFDGWKTLAFIGEPPIIEASTPYWICVWADDSVFMYRTADVAWDYRYKSLAYGAWPDTWAEDGEDDYRYSLFCTHSTEVQPKGTQAWIGKWA